MARMPLFDFDCVACGVRFEALVRPASYGDPQTACPACGSTELTRLPASFAVSSAERTRAFADAKNRKAAAVGRQETAARDREASAHRHEDH